MLLQTRHLELQHLWEPLLLSKGYSLAQIKLLQIKSCTAVGNHWTILLFIRTNIAHSQSLIINDGFFYMNYNCGIDSNSNKTILKTKSFFSITHT